MYFEAESNDIQYHVNVNETRTHWKVGLRPEGKDWIYYDIPKDDYQIFDETISFIFKDTSYLVDVVGKGTDYTVYTRGAFRNVKVFNEEKILHESLKGKSAMAAGDSLTAGMPGKISKVFVKPGDVVAANQPMLIMEAMKMENEMRAVHETKIKTVHVKPGDNVETGAVLISFEKK